VEFIEAPLFTQLLADYLNDDEYRERSFILRGTLKQGTSSRARAASPRCGGRTRGEAREGGGSSGIGLETARRARAEGADVILTARDPDRLHRVGLELGASITAFDAASRRGNSRGSSRRRCARRSARSAERPLVERALHRGVA